MRPSRPGPVSASQAAACLLALGVVGACHAASLEVTVTDERGQGVERVAVYATPMSASVSERTVAHRERPPAVMDQHDNQFVPHILVVEAGTEVLFPNSDSVSHHVYSFSPAKTFELGLYKGNVHPPMKFDEPGVVVLGCNIHDSMLGYIFVAPTPYFALTDERGVAVIEDLPRGEYTVESWTPRARPAGLPMPQPLSINADSATRLALRLSGRLAPDHDHGASSLSWERY
jgi:plastocyanin